MILSDIQLSKVYISLKSTRYLTRQQEILNLEIKIIFIIKLVKKMEWHQVYLYQDLFEMKLKESFQNIILNDNNIEAGKIHQDIDLYNNINKLFYVDQIKSGLSNI
ncbi:unnamed protein product [Paramecium sonneborni]|uniref:Uncharacterized protein n=1 Tax=Paramecium sonneborni TaxID=65129 RepID=A0A8S1KPB0_9CILI|nr:unnamed protein product [Paramecium sonneborni]